jgi:hypothetical protein
LFGNDVLIIVGNASFFFQSKDFIIGLGMVGRVLAGCGLAVGGFLPFDAESMSDSGGCAVGCFNCLGCFVVVILLLAAVAVAVPIIALAVVGIYSFGLRGLQHSASECPRS